MLLCQYLHHQFSLISLIYLQRIPTSIIIFVLHLPQTESQYNELDLLVSDAH